MARRPRFSIPTRVFLGFALVFFAFVGVVGTSLVQHERTAHNLRLIHEGYLPFALTLGEAKATQAVFATLLDRVMEERGTTATRSWINAARRVRPATLRRALHGLERAEKLAGASSEGGAPLARVRGELEAVGIAYDEGHAELDAFFTALEAGHDDEASRLLEQSRERERLIQQHFRDAFREMQERIATASADAAEQERRAGITLLAMTVFALLVGVAFTIWSQRVLSPIPLLHERVEAVARGDLSNVLEPRSEDELGQLTAAFERMVSALAARDANLREAARTQRAQKRMQEQIIEALRAAVVVVDARDEVRTANAASEAVLGLAQGAVGAPIDPEGPFGEVEALLPAIDEVRRTREPVQIEATPRHTSPPRQLDVRISPLDPEAHAEGSVLVVAEDVTEELATKLRLIHTERLAAIGRMAAHVTHEVRNPLSSIGLNVEMLEDEVPSMNEEARALLRAIHREIDRLTGITEEYLHLARMPEPRLTPDDPLDLVEEVVAFVRPEMTAAGVELLVRAPSALPLVPMDEHQLRQALLNLLRNAREASPGGGTIELSAIVEDDGVVLEIADHGVGIEPDVRDHIFDMFFSTKQRGTGLGLPLTQQIVIAHGGTIRCDARAPAGTSFRIWLPSAPVAAEPPTESIA
jgi:nitrogen fixation/metabolism regulation signal transduction histidine kinase